MRTLVDRLRALYQTHPVVMEAAAKLEQQSRLISEIAGSMSREWTDPAEHANWCIGRARENVPAQAEEDIITQRFNARDS